MFKTWFYKNSTQRMVEQSPQDERFRTISRFSTSTSLGILSASDSRMPSASDSSMQVVPMPRWSSAVGCTRFVLAILVLVFTSAATAIWGGYLAFGLALFTSSASLVIFAYYFVALSCRPALYNRWAVLGLEIFGVIFWLVSFAHLAEWTRYHNSFWYGDGDSYGFWTAHSSPSDVGLRTRSIVKRSTNRSHAGVALAGTAAGLCGIEFVLYLVTMIVFAMALHSQRLGERSRMTPTAPTTTAPETSETNAARTDAGEQA